MGVGRFLSCSDLPLGRMGGEPGLLVFEQLGGRFADVAEGFEGQLAGDVVGFVVGRGLDGGGPSLCCFDEFG